MMRIKQRALIITFDATTAAMAAERLCLQTGLPGRLIPVPREITAGCGLAWKAPPQEAQRLAQAFHLAAIPYAGMVEMEL